MKTKTWIRSFIYLVFVCILLFFFSRFYENIGLITREDVVAEIVGDEYGDDGLVAFFFIYFFLLFF
jgi:hypothetical protein